VIYTPVGEPYLAQAKLQCGAELGLEEHGSVLLEWSREGPMLAGIMAGILSKTEMSLSELVDTYPKYYQIKDAVDLPENTNTEELLEKIKREIHGYENLTDIDGIRANYSDGWFLIRASGTEPKIRVFSEAKTQKRAKELNETGINTVKEVI